MDTLEQATFKDLFEEMARRFPNIVVIAERPGEKPGTTESRFSFAGSVTMLAGLIVRGQIMAGRVMEGEADAE